MGHTVYSLQNNFQAFYCCLAKSQFVGYGVLLFAQVQGYWLFLMKDVLPQIGVAINR